MSAETPPPAGPETRAERVKEPGHRALLALFPALTFILGAVLGGVVIAVGGGSDGSAVDPRPTPSADSSSEVTATGPDTAVVVPAACNDAAGKVQDAVALLRSAADSVRDFDPQKLTDDLNALEDLDPQLRALAEQCSAVSVQPIATSSESEQPSSSP